MSENNHIIQILIENFNKNTLELFLDKKPDNFFLEKKRRRKNNIIYNSKPRFRLHFYQNI